MGTQLRKEESMNLRWAAIIGGLIVHVWMGGCVFSQTGKLLVAPSRANTTAARHNDEGIAAYRQGQWAIAKQHFEAAISASPTLAEAHYNLGMVLWETGNDVEATSHLMKAANLEPGNDVIANSPAMRGVQAPSKSFGAGLSSDGHGHSH